MLQVIILFRMQFGIQETPNENKLFYFMTIIRVAYPTLMLFSKQLKPKQWHYHLANISSFGTQRFVYFFQLPLWKPRHALCTLVLCRLINIWKKKQCHLAWLILRDTCWFLSLFAWGSQSTALTVQFQKEEGIVVKCIHLICSLLFFENVEQSCMPCGSRTLWCQWMLLGGLRAMTVMPNLQALVRAGLVWDACWNLMGASAPGS